MATLFQLPKAVPLSGSTTYPGAKAYFYQAGTTTPITTYTTAALSVPHANPVVADANGVFAPIFIDEGTNATYKLRLNTSTDVLIYEVDNLPTTLNQQALGAVLWPRTAAETSAGVIPTNYYYEPGDVRRYGTNSSPGSTDMTTALANAVVSNITVYVNETIKITSVITILGAVRICGSGRIYKAHTGDLFHVQAGNVTIEDVRLEALVSESATYATSGFGIHVENDVSTTPNFRANNLTTVNFDAGVIKFEADSGSGSHVTNLYNTPYVTTYGAESKCIITGLDTAARPRHFSNINAGGAIIQMGGAQDVSFDNVFCRRIEHHASDSLCSYTNIRYANLGNAMNIKGSSCMWDNCAWSGSPTLTVDLVNSFVKGITTSGAVVDNSNAGENTVFIASQTESAGLLSSNLDCDFAGGYRQTIDGWTQDNVTASQTNVELVRGDGRFRAVRAGSVLGVIVTSSEARTAGTLTVTVFKNTGLAGASGSTIGLTAVLDGTNTSRKATTQARNADTFVAGDEIYAVVTTDGSWLPTTADIRVAIEIET